MTVSAINSVQSWWWWKRPHLSTKGQPMPCCESQRDRACLREVCRGRASRAASSAARENTYTCASTRSVRTCGPPPQPLFVASSNPKKDGVETKQRNLKHPAQLWMRHTWGHAKLKRHQLVAESSRLDAEGLIWGRAQLTVTDPARRSARSGSATSCRASGLEAKNSSVDCASSSPASRAAGCRTASAKAAAGSHAKHVDLPGVPICRTSASSVLIYRMVPF